MKTLFTMLAFASILVGGSTVCEAEDSNASLKIVQNRAQSIVTLRVVSKLESNQGGQSANREMRYEVQGVVVDKEGLIMVSNVFLNPYSLRQTEEGAEPDIKLTPVSIKVVFAGDEKEYVGFVAATDKKLALDFIKVEDLAGKAISPVSFQTSATPVVGQELLLVSRMSRGFDYVPFFQTGQIAGEIVRPRKAWMILGRISGFGLPVFTLNDEVAGVLSNVPSSIKEDASNPDTMGLMGAGGGALQPFLIPCTIVEGLISQAKIRAVEVAEKRKNNKAANASEANPKSTVDPKPETPKKPDAPKKPSTPNKPKKP